MRVIPAAVVATAILSLPLLLVLLPWRCLLLLLLGRCLLYGATAAILSVVAAATGSTTLLASAINAVP